MRQILCALFAVIAAVAVRAGVVVKVVDGADGAPLGGATVFGRSGLILGFTDADGALEVADEGCFPLTVRCMGYEVGQCEAGKARVALIAEPFELAELAVSPGDRPVARLLCYIREYCSCATPTDTLICFNEHMGDVFLPVKDKVKGFKAKDSPRFLYSEMYTQMASSRGVDTVYSPTNRDDTFTWEMLMKFPKSATPTERMLSGAMADTVAGKYSPRDIQRVSPAGLFSVTTDFLADAKDHVASPFIFKMLGMSNDVTEMFHTWVFRNNGGASVYSSADLVKGDFSMSMLGKGKWIKKAFKSDEAVNIRCYYEIYPVDVEFLTVEDARELSKNPPELKQLQRSEIASPLMPSIAKIVERAKSK